MNMPSSTNPVSPILCQMAAFPPLKSLLAFSCFFPHSFKMFDGPWKGREEGGIEVYRKASSIFMNKFEEGENGNEWMNHGNDEMEGRKHPFLHQNTNLYFIFFEIQQKICWMVALWMRRSRTKVDHSFSQVWSHFWNFGAKTMPKTSLGHPPIV